MGRGELTEREYLAHEAEVAMAAIGQLRVELQNSLKLAADPQAWAQRYPWPALGTALAGGVAAAVTIKPMVMGSKHEQGRYAPAAPPPARKQRRMAWLWSPLFNLLKGSLKSAIIAGITAKAAAEAVDDDEPSADSAAEQAREPAGMA